MIQGSCEDDGTCLYLVPVIPASPHTPAEAAGFQGRRLHVTFFYLRTDIPLDQLEKIYQTASDTQEDTHGAGLGTLYNLPQDCGIEGCLKNLTQSKLPAPITSDKHRLSRL